MKNLKNNISELSLSLKLKLFFQKFINYFNPKFIDIDNQKVTKKFPWLLIFGWILGIIIFIYLVYKINPDFSNWRFFWRRIGAFFGNGDGFKIGAKEITMYETFIESLRLLWLTVSYSILGTIFGIILSIPIALLSSKNFIKTPWIYIPMRSIMSIIRAIPPVVFTFMFFYLVSNQLAATLSISLFISSLMAKWLYEDLDTYDVTAYHGLQAIGNSKILAFKKSILPYLSKRIFSYGFYSFEMVVRFAAILSVVGISTVGSLLTSEYVGPDGAPHISVVLWVLVAFIIFVEFLNFLVKKYILEFIPKHPKISNKDTFETQLQQLNKQKPKNYWWKIILIILILALVVASIFQIEWQLANHLKRKHFIDGIYKLFHPEWSVFREWNSNNPINSGLEALFVAIISSIIGLILSLFLGILASRNITGNYFSIIFKVIIIVIRAIPPFTYALLFILLTPNIVWAGALALGIHSIGMLGKLICESTEKIDNKIFQSLDSVGANWWQKIRFGVLKEIMPQTLSNFLYRVEINFKSTVVIGIVGASPFGQLISNYQAYDKWNLLSSFLIFTIILLLILEQISNILRKKLILGYFFEQNFFIKRWWRNYILKKALVIANIINENFVNDLKIANYINAKFKYTQLYLLDFKWRNENSLNEKELSIIVKNLNRKFKKDFKCLSNKFKTITRNVYYDTFKNSDIAKWRIVERHKYAQKAKDKVIRKFFNKKGQINVEK
ncbi:PhnE/PtxC family ABC transporter permease [Mycoplasmopsis lipofaciens]|uniref:PhnE/PtxC family ABC transporter permease n=1 Tax=Mycoplasmopsis lipofaciens TaxID=114884 RepID=UPI0004885F62|nr:ABC transporter permease subunit [Mycoplasmopsis lipofaciens]